MRRPPLAGVYGILCCMHRVRACVLLKMSLYCGNMRWMYFADLLAVSFVSCMVMIAGKLSMSLWRFGRAVFNELAFQVVNSVFS